MQNRSTQTEAEALPPLTPAPLAVQEIKRLVLFLAAASRLLAFAAGLPDAHARPLAASENFPSSAAHLFRSFVTISLVTIIAKKLASFAAATPYPEIPVLPESSTTAVAAFCDTLAAAAMYAWQGGNKAVFGEEVVGEEFLRHSRWEEFLRDPSNPEFADWKGEGNAQYARIIPDIHTKVRLKTAIIGLYSRILTTHETAKRMDDFIEWMKNKSPADALIKKLMKLTDRETEEESLAKAERWGAFMQHQYDQIWPLFPETRGNGRTSTGLLSYVQRLRGLWQAVGNQAAEYTRANGRPIDLGELKNLGEWLNKAPREFEKDVAMLFTPRPKTRDETIKRIQELIEGKFWHPQELAQTTGLPPETDWEDSLQGIEDLLAFAPRIDSWAKLLSYASSLSERQEESKVKIERDSLREQLDAANMHLELLKGTTSGGPQKYSVSLFDTCFTDVCSWNTWRNQALAWAKENPMGLGMPANALSWFSWLLSGSAHEYVVSNIANIFAETQGIHEAVQAAAGLLDHFFADPDAETRAIKRFWGTKQGNQRFGLFYMDWQAAHSALPNDPVSPNEQTRAIVQALRDGLRNKLEVHFLAQGVSRPTIEPYASFAQLLDRNCPDTACIPNTAMRIDKNSLAQAEKEKIASAGKRSPRIEERNENYRKNEREPLSGVAAPQGAG